MRHWVKHPQKGMQNILLQLEQYPLLQLIVKPCGKVAVS